jgi:hypothetical protein
MIVLLGVHELSGKRNDAQLSRNVVQIKIHEKYNPKHWVMRIIQLHCQLTRFGRKFHLSCESILVQRHRRPDARESRQVYQDHLACLFASARIRR